MEKYFDKKVFGTLILTFFLFFSGCQITKYYCFWKAEKEITTMLFSNLMASASERSWTYKKRLSKTPKGCSQLLKSNRKSNHLKRLSWAIEQCQKNKILIAELFLGLATKLLKEKKDQEAVNLLAKGAEKFPKNINFPYSIYEVMLKNKKGEQALTFLLKSVEMSPKNFALTSKALQLIDSHGLYEKGILLADKLIGEDQKNVEALLLVARIYINTQSLARGEIAFKKALLILNSANKKDYKKISTKYKDVFEKFSQKESSKIAPPLTP